MKTSPTPIAIPRNPPAPPLPYFHHGAEASSVPTLVYGFSQEWELLGVWWKEGSFGSSFLLVPGLALGNVKVQRTKITTISDFLFKKKTR